MSKLVENYLLQQPIGKGVYGQVFRALHQKSKLEYAVKVIPKSSFKANPKLEQLAINQINILSTLKNDNIVRFIETLKTPNNFYFVYEYCNGGTLESLLQKRKTLREEEALVIFRQLLDAFKQLNKNNIMHRDLKPDNIFFSDGKVKLGDFGFCKMLEMNMAQTMLGSPIYMAPQILKEEIYTLKADIWSLGVVLFEMLFGYCPFESSSISQLINVIKDNDLRIPKDINPISDQCETILNKMLVKDQFKRIEWVDLFDFKIDEQGRITSGYKKDLGIEALEKYFLFDIKNVAEVQFSDRKQQVQKMIFKQGVQSDKIIFSNKQLNERNNKQLNERNNKQLNERNNKELNERNNKELNDREHVTPSSITTTSEIKDQIKENFDLPLLQNHKSERQTFLSKHERWLRGIQLMDQLADCSDQLAQNIFAYILAALLKQINEQYQLHPEWTDVLMEQKRCLNDSLKAMGREQFTIDESAKSELLRIWRRGEERWKLMWGRAIRFIYNAENNQVEVEALLA